MILDGIAGMESVGFRSRRRSDGCSVCLSNGCVSVADEGGDGDYLHSILGMQSVLFVLLSRLFKHYLQMKAARACCYLMRSGPSFTVWCCVFFYDHYFVLSFCLSSLPAVHLNRVVSLYS